MTDIAGFELDATDREVLSHPLVGGVILFSRNYDDPEQLLALTTELHALRSPRLLIAVDHEGGRVQRFRQDFSELPGAGAIGEHYDRDSAAGLELAEQCGWLMAAELRAHDIDFSFAPVLDLRNARSRIIDDRAFHADANIVVKLALAYIKGVHRAGMAAVGKHFPGHGTVEADSHLELPVDERDYVDIEQHDLRPFRLTASNLEGMMPAHIRYPAIDVEPAGYSKVWIEQILRNELRFQGIVFSDDLNMSGAAMAGNIEDRAALAREAGCDVILACNDRRGTERLLSRYSGQIEPLSMVRLMRMHGKGQTVGFADLHEQASWRHASALAASVSTSRLLDLGDDMLS